jgi:hypothetical protein
MSTTKILRMPLKGERVKLANIPESTRESGATSSYATPPIAGSVMLVAPVSTRPA